MDKEKEWALIIEQANIQMKLALKECIVDSLYKEIVKSSVRVIVDNTKKALKDAEAPQELIEKTEKTLKLRFADWYTYITQQLLQDAKKNKNPLLFISYEEITGTDLKKSKGLVIELDGYKKGTIPNVQDYMTTGRTAGAQSFMDGYVSTVKKAMQAIADKNLVMKDRLGRKLSLRNLAEMTARFQNTQERLQKLKDEGTKYVVASSHSNASERCQIWQGKVFILDCEVGTAFKQKVDLTYKPKPIGKIDGIDYYSLKDAMLHGFLGYNCRHRLVKYMKGMDLFNEYSANTIAKERGLEDRQRYLERKIRKAKEKATLAVDPNERRVYVMESKHYQEEYTKFCQDKGLVMHEWRTRISRVERGLIDDPKERTLAQQRYEEQLQLRGELNQRVASGKIKLEINIGAQNKHIPGTNEYKTATQNTSKGILTADPYSLTKYLGHGILKTKRDGQIFEIVVADEIIGIHISSMKNERIPTKVFKVHFSKKGVHFVPIHPKKGKIENES